MKGGGDEVCRDFLNKTCHRGNKCKYRHPDQSEVKTEIKFCHDYQNRTCKRTSCRFIHCSKEEEEYYLQTGNLPPGIEEPPVLRSGVGMKKDFMSDGEIPYCKDYLKGACRRGDCKYRHMSRGDLEHEERMRKRFGSTALPSAPPDRYGDEYEHDRNRRWMDRVGYELEPKWDGRASGRDARDLEDENIMLRRKVEELRKTVADLTATNDVLLEQNARLRIMRTEATSAVLQAETHLVNSTATNSLQLSQGRSLGSTTNHTVAATTPVMYPARAAQVPIVAENALSAPGAALRESVQIVQNAQQMAPAMANAGALQPQVLTASMGQAQGHVVPMSAGVTASMVSYPIVSQTLRTVMS